VTVQNNSGADFNGPVQVAVHFSSDGVLDASDPVLVQSAKPMKLKNGQAKPVKFRVPLNTLPEGQFTLLGSATVSGLTASSAGPSLTVADPFVRLLGVPGAGGKPITLGKRASLSVPLQNAGNVPTTRAPATYTLLVSTDGTDAGAIFQTTAVGKLGLKPGASRPQKLSVTIPAGAFAPGAYTLIVKVNAELNETNGQTVALIPATFV
jgi:hypothetical protein